MDLLRLRRHSSLSYLFDACRPAPGPDALIIRRALSERSELVRPPLSCVRPTLMRLDGASLVWALLPEQKWLGRRDETRKNKNYKGKRGEYKGRTYFCSEGLGRIELDRRNPNRFGFCLRRLDLSLRPHGIFCIFYHCRRGRDHYGRLFLLCVSRVASGQRRPLPY